MRGWPDFMVDWDGCDGCTIRRLDDQNDPSLLARPGRTSTFASPRFVVALASSKSYTSGRLSRSFGSLGSADIGLGSFRGGYSRREIVSKKLD
jgi:hypothetical protein